MTLPVGAQVITPDGRRGEITRVYRTAGETLANVRIGHGVVPFCVADLRRAPDEAVDEGLFAEVGE